MDPRRGVTYLFFDKMLVSIVKAHSDKREHSLVMKYSRHFETRCQIAKEVNTRLQKYSKVYQKKLQCHNNMPCVTDLLEMVD